VGLAELLNNPKAKPAVCGFVAVGGGRHARHQQLTVAEQALAMILNPDQDPAITQLGGNQDRRRTIFKSVINQVVEATLEREWIKAYSNTLNISRNRRIDVSSYNLGNDIGELNLTGLVFLIDQAVGIGVKLIGD